MLTIQIDDAQLEQRIVEAAKAIGQTAQEFLRDLAMRETKTITKLPFEIPRLDPALYAQTIDFGIDDENLNKETITLFAQVHDAGEYIHNLRKQTRN
jgi:hypothetical protein